MDKTNNEKVLAYHMVRELAALILMGSTKKSLKMQDGYIAFAGYEKYKSEGDMEKIANGKKEFTHDEAEKLALFLMQKTHIGRILPDPGVVLKEEEEKEIKNLKFKLKLLEEVLKYFLEVHDTNKEKIEEIFDSAKKSINISNLFISDLTNNERYEIVYGPYTSEKDIDDAIELDSVTYEEIYRGKRETCISWSKVNPYIYFFVKDKALNKVVAYINIMPVSEDRYNKLRDDEFNDVDIPETDVISYDMPGFYNLYFSSVVIEEKYRGKGILNFLLRFIVEYFSYLAEHDIFFKKMIACPVTDQGIHFCKLFNMKPISENSSIFEVSIFPSEFNFTVEPYKKLYEVYSSKLNYEKKSL